ncbi:MAG TPA: tetraacyldisaccharide 4'-kinase [Hyphomicrobium sp.]|nr:tetraacyldisaccharide 4'-kinase [Hyphomicrobium sp.]
MRLDEPTWWYGDGDDVRRRILSPLGRLYGWAAERRYYRRQPYRSRLPVICVGNFTAGGTGKTPLSIAIARMLIDRGERPVFLTRGYGGRTRGPAWVEDGPGAAKIYGDEPLLLAAVAPTLVARDRRAGVITIEADQRPHTIVVMDDGLQNPAIVKDLAIALVDGKRGIGNGEVIPAGPLRAPFDFQIGLADAIVVRDPPAGEDPGGVYAVLRRGFHGPVMIAHVAASGDTSWVAQRPLLAFAGIANPRRFYRLLEKLGGKLADTVSFPDHHPFTPADAAKLLGAAGASGAQLVTTEKDFMRLKGDAALAELAAATRTVAIEMHMADSDAVRLTSLVDGAVKGTSRRQRPPAP